MDFDMTAPGTLPDDAGDGADGESASPPPAVSSAALIAAGQDPDGSLDPFAIDALIDHAQDVIGQLRRDKNNPDAGAGAPTPAANQSPSSPSVQPPVLNRPLMTLDEILSFSGAHPEDPRDLPASSKPRTSPGSAMPGGVTPPALSTGSDQNPIRTLAGFAQQPWFGPSPIDPFGRLPGQGAANDPLLGAFSNANGGLGQGPATPLSVIGGEGIHPASGLPPGRGGLSMIYETGYRPGQEDLAAGKFSSGVGDPDGGPSYGAFQLSSNKLRVQDFLAHEGAPWAQKFAGQDPKTGNGAFASTWKAVAAQQPAAFFDAQHHYIERTHFDPVVAKVMKQTGLDITSRSPAVQDAVWSTAVQHRAAPGLIVQTVNSLRGVIAPDDPNYDRAFINKLYDIRSKYVADGHYAVGRNRYADERRDALKMLGQ